MGSKKSDTIKASEADVFQAKGNDVKDIQLRFSTIRCGISPPRGPNGRSRLRNDVYREIFLKIAHSIGAYRHVVSLVANQIILYDQDLVCSQGGWQMFYYRVWTAVDAVCNNLPTRNCTEYYNKVINAVREALQKASEKKHLDCMPKAVNWAFRQQEAVTMATQTKEYLETFPHRVRRKLAVEIASACSSMLQKDVDTLATRSCTYVFCYKSMSSKKRDEIFDDMSHVEPEDKEKVLRIADDERRSMDDLVKDDDTIPPTTTVNQKRTSWFPSLMKQESHKLLVHMIRISTWSEKWLERHFEASTLSLPIDDDDDEREVKEVVDKSGRKWSKKNLPKPFSVLPICKLQPAMVFFGASEVRAMMEHYVYEEKVGRKKGQKRAREGEIPRTSAAYSSCSAPPVPTNESVEDYFKRRFDGQHFGDIVFDRKSFKGRRGPFVGKNGEPLHDANGTEVPKWRIACFRTDGVSAAITFVSGICEGAFNADNLFKKGYSSIVEPTTKVDLLDPKARGLYYVGQKRNDILPVNKSTMRDVSIRISAVDPGFCKPVHVASVRMDAQDPIADAQHDFVTESELMEQSGRNMRRKAEEERRRVNIEYGEVLRELEKVGRGRKSTSKKFNVYFDTMLHTMKVRQAELVCEARSWLRWKGARRKLRFVGRLCDVFFDRSTLRFKRRERHARLDASLQPGVDVNAQQVDRNNETVSRPTCELRKKEEEQLHKTRLERRSTRSVVFFGDATFGPTMRGHNSIPKKTILAELCHRGPTFLLDEYRTSLCCPCGKDELKTTTGRNRAHKSDGSTCHFLAKHSDRDRDQLASLNMIQCALRAIEGAERPAHLCRSNAPCFTPQKSS